MLVSITFTLSLFNLLASLPSVLIIFLFFSLRLCFNKHVGEVTVLENHRERERETTHTHKTNTLHDQTDYFFSILGLFLLLRFSCLINEKIDSLVRPLLFSRLSVYDEYCLKKKN